MRLERPICFLDIESTHLNLDEARIIELSITKVSPASDDFSGHTRENKTWFINPGIPIPEESSLIHGIYDKDVDGLPVFEDIADEVGEFIQNSDFGGFNSNRYDIPLLYRELARIGIELDYHSRAMVDVGNIFKINEERTLKAAVKFYLDREHEGAHGAKDDTEATVDVFVAQLERYPPLPKTVEEMALYSNYCKPVLDLSGKFTTNDKGQYEYNFGPHKGKLVESEMGFLNWMLGKDFPKDTVEMICQIREELADKEAISRSKESFETNKSQPTLF